MAKETKSSSLVHLRGKVLGFNLSAKGHIAGVLIETAAGPVQINFPKHEAPALAQSMELGSEIDLKVKFETLDGAHPVYTASGEEAETSGTVVRLNYALQGQVNGYHLDDGTFLYLKLPGKKKWKLRVGDKVKATGSRHMGPKAVVLAVSTLEQLDK